MAGQRAGGTEQQMKRFLSKSGMMNIDRAAGSPASGFEFEILNAKRRIHIQSLPETHPPPIAA